MRSARAPVRARDAAAGRRSLRPSIERGEALARATARPRRLPAPAPVPRRCRAATLLVPARRWRSLAPREPGSHTALARGDPRRRRRPRPRSGDLRRGAMHAARAVAGLAPIAARASLTCSRDPRRTRVAAGACPLGRRARGRAPDASVDDVRDQLHSTARARRAARSRGPRHRGWRLGGRRYCPTATARRGRPSRARAPSARRPSRPGRGWRPGPARARRPRSRRTARRHGRAGRAPPARRRRTRSASAPRPGRAQPAPAEPASRTARRRRGGRRRARNAGCADESVRRPNPVSTSGRGEPLRGRGGRRRSSAPAHSSQPSCEPAPGTGEPSASIAIALAARPRGDRARAARAARAAQSPAGSSRASASSAATAAAWQSASASGARGVAAVRRARCPAPSGWLLDRRDRVAPALLGEAAGARRGP